MAEGKISTSLILYGKKCHVGDSDTNEFVDNLLWQKMLVIP